MKNGSGSVFRLSAELPRGANAQVCSGWLGWSLQGTKMDESLKTERPSGPLDGKFKYKTKQDGTVDRQKVLCTLCWKEFSFHRSTSSLKYHLNAKHQHVVDFANTSETAAPRLRQSTLTRRRELSKSTADELTDTNAKQNTAVKPFHSSTDMVTLGLYAGLAGITVLPLP